MFYFFLWKCFLVFSLRDDHTREPVKIIIRVGLIIIDEAENNFFINYF